MKLHIPPGWARSFKPDPSDHIGAGPTDVEGLLSELDVKERVVPALAKHAKEISRRGWLRSDAPAGTPRWSDAIAGLLGRYLRSSVALFRGSFVSAEQRRHPDPRLVFWLAYLNAQSSNEGFQKDYVVGDFLESHIHQLALLSVLDDGPLRAIELLRSLGIIVIVSRALPGTRVDGCAFWSEANRPLIGLSLRYDRLDNFWFSLLHECAHVALHLRGPGITFVDDLESDDKIDEFEVQANLVARDAAIPRMLWKRSEAAKWPSEKSILELASSAGVHPSLVAGRVRFETQNYRNFTNLLGHGQISSLFGSWE